MKLIELLEDVMGYGEWEALLKSPMKIAKLQRLPTEADLRYLILVCPSLAPKAFQLYIDRKIAISPEMWILGIQHNNNLIRIAPKNILNPSVISELIKTKQSAIKELLTRVEIPENQLLNAIQKNGQLIVNVKSPSDKLLNIALTELRFIKKEKQYNTFVRNHFKNNTVLMNKWLRYAKNMRELG